MNVLLVRYTCASTYALHSYAIMSHQGIAFRATIKNKRSITSFRDRVPTLPRNTGDFTIASAKAGVFGAVFPGHEKTASQSATAPSSEASTSHAGFGFGRQGEKHAGLKG